jgi:hypothetical protein
MQVQRPRCRFAVTCVDNSTFEATTTYISEFHGVMKILVCEKGATAPAVKEAGRRLNRERSRLKKDTLRQYQEEWVEERRDWPSA